MAVPKRELGNQKQRCMGDRTAPKWSCLGKCRLNRELESEVS